MKRATFSLVILLMVASFIGGAISSAQSVLAPGDSVIPQAVVFSAMTPTGPQWWFRVLFLGREVIPPTFIGQAVCPTDVQQVADLVGGDPQTEWRTISEQDGTAFVFQSSDGQSRPLRLLIGILDTPSGENSTLNTFSFASAATYRCKMPAGLSVSTCLLGKDLAARNGWTVSALPESVTRFGGAVVNVPTGAVLPPDWEFQGPPGLSFSSGGIFTIYPPNGACRDQLDVSR